MKVNIHDPNNTTVFLDLTHSHLSMRITEARFDLYMTINGVKVFVIIIKTN